MLIKCKACEKDMSKKADKCPSCGDPNVLKETKEAGIKFLLGALLLGVIVWWVWPSGASAQEKYIPKVIKITGDPEMEAAQEKMWAEDKAKANIFPEFQRRFNKYMNDFNVEYNAKFPLMKDLEIAEYSEHKGYIWKFNSNITLTGTFTKDSESMNRISALIIPMNISEQNSLNVLISLMYMAAYANIKPEEISVNYMNMVGTTATTGEMHSFIHNGISYISMLSNGVIMIDAMPEE